MVSLRALIFGAFCLSATVALRGQAAVESWSESPTLSSVRKEVDREMMEVPPRHRPKVASEKFTSALKRWKANRADDALALKALLLQAYALTDLTPEDLPSVDPSLTAGKQFRQEYELERAVYLVRRHPAKFKEYRELRPRLLAKAPNDLLLLLAVSFDESWKGDPTRGIEYAQRAAKLEPRNYHVFHRLAIGHHYRYDKSHSKKDAQEAIRNYEQFLQLGPADNWRAPSVKQRVEYLKKKIGG